MKENKSIGKIISTLRKNKGWTQSQLAEKLNVSDKAVSKWEQDNGDPSIEFFPKLADLFGVTIDYLFSRKSEGDKFMKCTVCGCEKLKEIKIIDNQVLATEGYVAQTVNSYACEKCGHVELYIKQKEEKKNFNVWGHINKINELKANNCNPSLRGKSVVGNGSGGSKLGG